MFYLYRRYNVTGWFGTDRRIPHIHIQSWDLPCWTLKGARKVAKREMNRTPKIIDKGGDWLPGPRDEIEIIDLDTGEKIPIDPPAGEHEE